MWPPAPISLCTSSHKCHVVQVDFIKKDTSLFLSTETQHTWSELTLDIMKQVALWSGRQNDWHFQKRHRHSFPNMCNFITTMSYDSDHTQKKKESQDSQPWDRNTCDQLVHGRGKEQHPRGLLLNRQAVIRTRPWDAQWILTCPLPVCIPATHIHTV